MFPSRLVTQTKIKKVFRFIRISMFDKKTLYNMLIQIIAALQVE